MNIPDSLYRLAMYFHQDALVNNITVKAVLSQFTYNEGVDLMCDIQLYLSDSLKTDTPDLMQLKWEKAESALDFEEFTEEFFREVVSFDTTPFINLTSRKQLPVVD